MIIPHISEIDPYNNPMGFRTVRGIFINFDYEYDYYYNWRWPFAHRIKIMRLNQDGANWYLYMLNGRTIYGKN